MEDFHLHGTPGKREAGPAPALTAGQGHVRARSAARRAERTIEGELERGLLRSEDRLAGAAEFRGRVAEEMLWPFAQGAERLRPPRP